MEGLSFHHCLMPAERAATQASEAGLRNMLIFPLLRPRYADDVQELGWEHAMYCIRGALVRQRESP